MPKLSDCTLRVGAQLVEAAYFRGQNLVAPAYTLPTPILLQGFESLTGFSAGNGALLSIDTTRKVQGDGSLAIGCPGASSAPHATTTSFLPSVTPSSLGVVAIYRDGGDDPEYQNATGVDVRFGRGGTYYTQAGVTNATLNEANVGGRWDSFHISEVASVNSLPEGQLDLRLQTSHVAPYAQTIRTDALLANAAGRPTVILTFDDIRPTQYTTIFAAMQSRGLKGTLYVPTALIGAADRLTLAQIKELYAAGWDTALGGTPDDNPMTGKASVASVIADYQAMQAYMTSEGLTRAIDHFCYPNGSTRTPGTKIQSSAVTTNGSAVATMASTTGILAGMKAAGYQVPVGTTVVSVDSGTQVTLSGNVPTQTKPMSFTDTSGEFHTGKLQSALRAAGVKSGRMTTNGTFYSRYGIADRGRLLPGNSGSAATLSSLQPYVDQCLLRGNTGIFYFHEVKNPTVSGLDMLTTEFEALLDYLVTKRDAGELDVLTISQWWARDCASPATLPLS